MCRAGFDVSIGKCRWPSHWAENKREYRRANSEKTLAMKKRWYYRHRRQNIKARARRYLANKEQTIRRVRDWKEIQKTKMRVLLGGRCVSCGYDNLEILQFDHITPVGSKSPRGFWVVKKNPELFQLLCPNCHKKKTAVDLDWNRKKYWPEAVQQLGGRCASCGLAEIECLEIDHVEPKFKTGVKYLDFRKKPKSLDGLQVLCCNCHAEKSNSERKELRKYA